MDTINMNEGFLTENSSDEEGKPANTEGKVFGTSNQPVLEFVPLSRSHTSWDDRSSPSSLSRLSTPFEMEEAPRVAYIYASPLTIKVGGRVSEVDQLDTRKELNLIRQMLSESKRHLSFRVEVATSQNLRMLVTLGCRMLHYAGHGRSEDLCFENACGEVHALGVGKLKSLFSAGGVRTQVVFVSACHSESAGRAFADAGVPHVVAVRTEARVSDQASRDFAQSFYLPLLMGHTVQQAFDIGVNSVAAAANASAGNKFLLLPGDGNHDVAPFNDAIPGKYIDETPALPKNMCDRPPAHFLGRNIQMQEIFENMATGHRCVTIKGSPGSGKTALALRTCEYVNQRRLFESGIYFVPLSKLRAGPLNMRPLCLQVSRALELGTIASTVPELVGRFQDLMGPGEERKALVVLDGADSLLSGKSTLVELINNLLRRTKGLYFLVTSCEALLSSPILETFEQCDSPQTQHQESPPPPVAQLENEAEKVIHLHPLSPMASAVLLIQLSPRKLKVTEMRHVPPPVSDSMPPPPPPTGRPNSPLAALSQHPVVEALGGNPRAIARFAPMLQSQDLDISLKERAEGILEAALTPTIQPTELRSFQSESAAIRSFPSDSELSRNAPKRRHHKNRSLTMLLEGVFEDAPSHNHPFKSSPGLLESKDILEDEFGPENQGGVSLSELGLNISKLDVSTLRNQKVRRRNTGDTKSGASGAGDSPVVSERKQRVHLAAKRHLKDPTAVDIWTRLASLGHEDGKPGNHHSTVNWHAMKGELKTWMAKVLCSNLEDLPWVETGDIGIQRANAGKAGAGGAVVSGAVDSAADGAGVPMPRIRNLNEHDLDYLKNKLVSQDGQVHLKEFKKFSEWWEPLLLTIRRLRHEWNSVEPCLIKGFVDRRSAESLLQDQPEGTFLMRFSDTRPGWLAISFTTEAQQPENTKENCVQHCLVEVQPDGCVIYFTKGRRKYSSLQRLIQGSPVLTTFFPATDKNLAFENISV